jgi:hypothetical protein
MKAMSPGLRTLLATGQYVKADCWTLTLNGGAVVRWTGADRPINANGNSFALGPAIKRGAISEKRGVEVATLSCEITGGGPYDLINGQPVIDFIRRQGLDGAIVKLEQAFAPTWASMALDGALGTLIRFGGRNTSVPEIKGDAASLTFSSWMILLNQMMPRNLYQAACLHTVYDAGCTLNPASFSTAGHITAVTGPIDFTSNLSLVADDYALGRIVFTSGANNGLSRTVRNNDSSGFSLIQPLPGPMAIGDNFTAFPGCDLTSGRCLTRFNNLDNFKGTEFVPQPQTPLGSQSTTTTTRSGKG